MRQTSENADGSGAAQEEQGPMNSHGQSNQVNHERVQEHQRQIAGETILGTTCGRIMLGCLGCILCGILATSFSFHITGWMVWSKNRAKPCDEPLQWWLFAMLLMPVIQCQLNNHVSERIKRLMGLIMPALLCSGAYLVVNSKTCSETNPALYGFAKMYLIFQSAMWLTVMCLCFGFLSVIMWAHQRGLLPNQGAGPSNPEKPGTIDLIETVPFSPELFAGITVDGNDVPECSICQEEFNSEKTIKQTPCGHFFHEECLAQWLERFAKSCPLCRANIEEALQQQNESGQQSPQLEV
jgi:hypothetical protein